MNRFKVTNQTKLFPENGQNYEFHIKDDLLFNCIGLGSSNALDPHGVVGFNRGKALGYALLTYFASRALEFRRLPFCEDRIYSEALYNENNTKKIIKDLDENRVKAICNELLALYKHSQRHLAQASVQHVYVRRELKSDNLGYVETIIRLKRSAELLGICDISFEMDTLNSFGDEGAYYGEIALELAIPVKDVLYCSRLVGNRPNQRPTMESGEWVILNDSPTGIVSFPTSSIHVKRGMRSEERPFSKSDAEDFIKNYNPIVLRPLHHTPQRLGTHGLRPTLKSKIIQKALAYLNKDV